MARAPVQAGDAGSSPAPVSNVTAERLGEAQQGARNASLYGKKVCGNQRFIGVTQPSREQGGDVTVKFRR